MTVPRWVVVENFGAFWKLRPEQWYHLVEEMARGPVDGYDLNKYGRSTTKPPLGVRANRDSRGYYSTRNDVLVRNPLDWEPHEWQHELKAMQGWFPDEETALQNDNFDKAQDFAHKIQNKYAGNFFVKINSSQLGSVYATVYLKQQEGAKPINFKVRFANHAEHKHTNNISVDPISTNTVDDALRLLHYHLKAEGGAPRVKVSHFDSKTGQEQRGVAQYNRKLALFGKNPFTMIKDWMYVRDSRALAGLVEQEEETGSTAWSWTGPATVAPMPGAMDPFGLMSQPAAPYVRQPGFVIPVVPDTRFGGVETDQLSNLRRSRQFRIFERQIPQRFARALKLEREKPGAFKLAWKKMIEELKNFGLFPGAAKKLLREKFKERFPLLTPPPQAEEPTFLVSDRHGVRDPRN